MFVYVYIYKIKFKNTYLNQNKFKTFQITKLK